ncbi:MAG: glycosyltransferase [Rhizobiaceae bacterium]
MGGLVEVQFQTPLMRAKLAAADAEASAAFSNVCTMQRGPALLPTRSVEARSTSERTGSRSAVLDTILQRRQSARTAHSVLHVRLTSLGVSRDDFTKAVYNSKRSGASVIEELIAAGTIDAETYYRHVALDLGVPFVASIAPSTILSEMNPHLMDQGTIYELFTSGEAGLSFLHTAPDLSREASLRALLTRDPDQKKRIRICTPRTIAIALEAKSNASNLSCATNYLHAKHPELSAKQVFAPWQAYLLGAFCVALPVCLYHQLLLTAQLILLFASLLFSLVIAMRIAALRSLKKRKSAPAVLQVGHYPKYSVLIALHKEAPVASQLVQAMRRLDWPSSRLEVLYVCEADDSETIEALMACGFPNHHRIIKVPAGAPRTKPKALNYALKTCRGDYVVIYDAEDRPHPQQLKEAWSRFQHADETLACLQAPLLVTNARSSWLSRMFAFEYASHFSGLLPYLAEAGIPLPLGGTSNHFKRLSLEAVGGWDPYNVTEDADLGIRLYRFGFKCGVLNLPTLEDGPETWKEWYPQRTRWQKGWMQTFLVQNRSVSVLLNKLGARNASCFEALLAGFILSPLLYTFSILMAAYSIYSFDPAHLSISAFGLMLLFMGYFCAIAMGLECCRHWSLREKAIVVSTLPLYWLLLSAAAWRAVYQLIIKPHFWEKTPHRPVAIRQVASHQIDRSAISTPVLDPAQ